MANLLDTYEEMLKEAEEQKIVDARIEVLSKYASVAEELLQAEYPNDYAKEDIVELADALITRDTEIAEQQEKVAGLDELGRSMAHEMLKKASGRLS